jgi:diguanylate cyclase (GGDEF)-like protein/PAS domain S-box-containing protein
MEHSTARAAQGGPHVPGFGKNVARLFGVEVVVGAIFLVSALAAVAGTRAADGVALIWPSTAIAASLLVRARSVRWPLAIVVLLAAGVLANRFGGGDAWQTAAALAAVNVLEIGVAAYCFRVLYRFPYPEISIFQASFMTLVMAILVTGGGALLASGALHLLEGKPLWGNLRNWWAADAIGVCMFAPPIILFGRDNVARLMHSAHLRANLLSIPMCVLVTYVSISQVPFPFVLIALAPMLAAFQVGAFGTSILSTLNCVTVVGLWLAGIRPIGAEASGGGALDGLPFIALIATTMPPIAVGLGTDARRRIARTLRSNERRFRESMEHSPLGIVLLDRAGKWTFINPAMRQMLGYSREEMNQLTIESFAHPDEVADIYQRWNQLLEGKVESYKINRRFRRKDGGWLWAHCAVSLTRDENGAPKHFVAQVESLEERRLAEARLANEREFLRITLDSIGDAVITADAEGRITYMNDPAVALTGKQLVSTRHQPLHEVLRLTQAEGAVAAPDIIDRCRRERSFVKRDEPCVLERPDGSACYVSDTATPVVDADGTLSGFVIVLHDVTVSLQRTRELHHRADHDALTGLLNRAAFERNVHQAFVLAARIGTPSALIVMDLDRFKAVNDSAGHAAGDAVLRHVAAVMHRSVRPADAVGRLGGDEFGVLLADCDPARSREVAARLREVLNPLVTSWEGVTHATGASLGLAQYGSQFADPGEWLKAADLACYDAKRRKRAARDSERTGRWAWSI